jgi:aspartate aminotransferase
MLPPMDTMTHLFELSDRARNVKPSATFAVTERVKQLRSEGVDVIGFGAGEPDFDTPPAICRAAIDALESGMTHYMPVPGDPAARATIAEKLRRENGVQCSPTDIVISAGAKHSIYLALQCLLDPGRGQEVVVPTPAWVSYRPMVELAGGTVVEVPGAVENDFRITPEQLESAIGPATVAVMLNSPSNPCGTMYAPDDLKALVEVIAGHDGVCIIADEIYEKLIFGGLEHWSPGSDPAIAERVITINGLSKAYAMTGWRIGYACAPGRDGLIAKAMSRLQGQMTSCITSFSYPAIVEALTHGADAVESMRKEFGRRAGMIHDLIARWPDVRCPRPTGAFYVFPDMRAHIGRTSPEGRSIDSSVTLAEALLEEARVAVVPGQDFGACASTHVRLSFAASDEQINEGCARVERWLRSLEA